MKLGVFSVIGEALNFGARKIETTSRIGWIAVLLLLICNMTTVFVYLSLIAGRAITFDDVQTYMSAQSILAKYSGQAWSVMPMQMGAVTLISAFVQLILVSSFMAPMIRFAGLNEKPSPGLFRLPFGAEQLRFIIAGLAGFFLVAIAVLLPIAGASVFIFKYLTEALNQTMISFPDPESIHTFKVVTSGQVMAQNGTAWIYDFALPLTVLAPIGVAFIALMVFHFRARAGGVGWFIRAFIVALLTILAMGWTYLQLHGVALSLAASETSTSADALSFSGSPVNAVLMVVVLICFWLAYANMRLFAYPGIAVCNRSLSPRGLLPVTRSGNILRLTVILIVISVLMTAMQFVINNFILGWVLQTVNALYMAVDSSTRLLNEGSSAEWIRPVFVWSWNLIKMLVTIIWMFFSYGVLSGLYGRLFKEGLREA